ncbi:hypothetical protein [Prevotella sp.]|uniref:hypothetical protein n=1 Tax=uncultured Prevotella sp. TaxID=159272 RepID=UPI00262DAA41|nr:hypothetical protein [uncultured Prevotella sp.]
MEKKEYIKPQINVIAIDAVGIMAGSGPETIKKGKPGLDDELEPEPDEDGYFWGE